MPIALRRTSTPVGSRAQEMAEFFDEFATSEERWLRRAPTYQRLIRSVMRFLIPPGATVLEIGSGRGNLLAALEPRRGLGIDVSPRMVEEARRRHPTLEFACAAGESFLPDESFDYVVLSDLLPYADDLLAVFGNVARVTHPGSRIVINSYSQVWRPIIRLAELLGVKAKKPIRNWVTVEDARNLLDLAGIEVISTSRRILFPVRIPLLSPFLNGVVASIWPFSHLCLTYWIVARPRSTESAGDVPVSVIVPCRNEAGMIAEIVERVPELGTGTELVFVEGGSTDGTREEIERQIAQHPERRIVLLRQSGAGKGDAVRLGFDQASGEFLMILDGDLTVSPEDLPKFYEVLLGGRGDLVNGSRLVYDLEPNAMQFLNVIGNKVFSLLLSVLIDQYVKDTLCGTKALRRVDWEAIRDGRSYFGDFDPFGDFDLLLGSARLGLKIVDLPVRYGSRRYGATNISRFAHGWLLLRMTLLAFVKFKVQPVRL